MQADYEFYDVVISDLHAYGPDLIDGLFNHAPMVVEALCAMGLGDRAAAWVEGERPGFATAAPLATPITETNLVHRLGRPERFADWRVFFEAQIATRGWRTVLDIWAGRLAPGLTSAACHGFLRTAHAARALRQEENAVRLRELAFGLAAWTAAYQELPVAPQAGAGTLSIARALEYITPLPQAHRPGEGLITAGYAALDHAEDFAQQAAAVAFDGPVARQIDALMAAFARLFLQAADLPFQGIVFTHAITPAAALRHVAPVVSRESKAALIWQVWINGCALKAAFHTDPVCQASASFPPRPPEALARAAADHGDDHVIKLTEACLAAYRRRRDPLFLTVPQRLAALLPAQTGTDAPTLPA